MPKNITKNQHYVPQTYLKGFSDSTGLIHVFDKEQGVWINRSKGVTTKEELYEKYLYEYYNEVNEIISPNYNENVLRNIENKFNKYKERLSNSIKLRKRNPLRHSELDFWRMWIILQIMRHPNVIALAKEEAAMHFATAPEHIRDYVALSYCLPFVPRTNSFEIYESFYNVISKMSCSVGYLEGNSANLITSDMPVYVYGKMSIDTIKKIIFPVSNNMCLFFTPRAVYEGIFKMEQEDINEVLFAMIQASKRIIVSPDETLSKQQINEWSK